MPVAFITLLIGKFDFDFILFSHNFIISSLDKDKFESKEKLKKCGVYGTYNEESNYLRDRECVMVASRNEIELGKAMIYSSVEEGRKSRKV